MFEDIFLAIKDFRMLKNTKVVETRRDFSLSRAAC